MDVMTRRPATREEALQAYNNYAVAFNQARDALMSKIRGAIEGKNLSEVAEISAGELERRAAMAFQRLGDILLRLS